MVLARVLQLVADFRTQQHVNLRGLLKAWSRTCGARVALANTTRHTRARSALARQHAQERLGRAAELLASGDLDLLGYELATADIQSALSCAHSGRVRKVVECWAR